MDFNTSEELPQTANIAVYQNSTVFISGLAMGTDYKFQYKVEKENIQKVNPNICS